MGGTANLGRIVATAGAAGALLLGSGVGAASAAGVNKLSLTETNRDCDGAVIGSRESQAFGSANVNLVGSGAIVAKVSVRGGDPNAEYGVRLIQVPSEQTNDCGNYLGPFEAVLTTDDAGSGTLQMREAAIAGASGVFVVLNRMDAAGTHFFTTALSPL